jgi:hypothetical protein
MLEPAAWFRFLGSLRSDVVRMDALAVVKKDKIYVYLVSSLRVPLDFLHGNHDPPYHTLRPSLTESMTT